MPTRRVRQALGPQCTRSRIHENIDEITTIVWRGKRGEAQCRSEDSHIVDHKYSLFG